MNQKDCERESKFETLTSKVFRLLQKAISIGKENFEHCKYSNGKHRRIAIAVANFKLVRWNKKKQWFQLKDTILKLNRSRAKLHLSCTRSESNAKWQEPF